jgi:hypothetical protein
MNETLSTRQFRLVGLLLVIVVCAGGYWTVVKGHNSSSSTSPSGTVSSTPSATTPSAHGPATAHTHPATPPKAATKLATGGLPLAVAQALQKHSVVVVSLSEPTAGLDQLASGEAKAGAAASNAGFVELDVFYQRPGIALLHKLGVVDTPAVLVVKRPHLVYAHFQGFVDRGVVEQSVADARG